MYYSKSQKKAFDYETEMQENGKTDNYLISQFKVQVIANPEIFACLPVY